MILVWLLVWAIENTPKVVFSPSWNVWAVTLVIAIVLA